ncbi:MAG TPA: hypothetical protein VHT91_36065, partial [Kofleriaceae bacterium]|nr:hypothetical protein [Kofleriaceae bacterium]
MSDARLTFATLAVRRELPSDHCELAPVAAPQLAAYGSEGQTTAELQLALAELADEARPTTVARFLLSYAPAALQTITVELATTPLAQATGRKTLAGAERARLAYATLDAAGRRVAPPDPPPPVVGRDALLAELHRVLGAPVRRSVVLVGDEAAGKSALVAAWAAAQSGRGASGPAGPRPMWATSAAELIAGASGLGEWQDRVAKTMAAAETLDAVLYLDDFGALFADKPEEGG